MREIEFIEQVVSVKTTLNEVSFGAPKEFANNI